MTGKCDTFTCSGEVHGKAVTFSLKIDRSQDPLSAEMSVTVKDPKFDWSHTFKSGDKVQMEGLPQSTVFLNLTMVKTGKGIAFKVDFSDIKRLIKIKVKKDCTITFIHFQYEILRIQQGEK